MEILTYFARFCAATNSDKLSEAFDAAQATLVGIELMHMIKKRQLVVEEGNEGLTAAELFYSLAA